MMEHVNFSNELLERRDDAFLPVEKKWAAWSLGIGVTLLWVLFAVSRLYPLN